MTETASLDNLTPHAAPMDQVARTVLLAIRRLAIGGLTDAHAVAIFLGNFGIAYRRPLMFLRILVGEVSRIAKRPIHVAPCCCPRMTEGEATFLTIIHIARKNPDGARAALARMTGSLDCLPAISVSQGLADALDDIGHPFELSTNDGSFGVTFM